MRITRLYLRNYRVYEGPVELELPAGLVGIYGHNGAGKSALVESILWTLWGKTRTTKDEVRTAGINADCVTEVEFEHEGHLYLVRRTVTGVNHTVKAEAHADRLQVAEGVKDTARYVHSILGMDDVAFRASVFAEQKQLAAFSDQTPSERRRLVQQLLGITPLEVARDRARKDARTAEQDYGRLRALLPDLPAMRVAIDDAVAAADANDVDARNEEAVAATSGERLAAAKDAFAALDEVRQRHEVLVSEGKGVRGEHDELCAQVTTMQQELERLTGAAERLAELGPVAAKAEPAEARLALIEPVLSTAAAVAALPAVAAPASPEAAAEAEETARVVAEEAAAALAGIDGQLTGARAAAEAARTSVSRAGELSGEADCPLCGQALGAAFEQVQEHRADELRAAEAALDRLTAERAAAAKAAKAASAAAASAREALRGAQAAWAAYERDADRRAAAEDAFAVAVLGLGLALGVTEVNVDELAADRDELRRVVAEARTAADEAHRLEGRLEARPELEQRLTATKRRAEDAGQRLDVLRAEVKSLAFDPAALGTAREALDQAAADAEKAERKAREARLAAERARMHAEAEAARLAEAEAQHARIADLAEESRHLGRLAELLNAFRNSVVATVGPRLAAQAAELFGELTDHEYDRLDVDPETYELKIQDGGLTYGMSRFSGSEIDLANLALRVAISEHVRFQSGGAVGLLVLDEVFGPLDDDRKERMLLALERLKGRFRQILVITHASEIKEQLPNAIEVIKLPGRRGDARLVAG
ncbi:MAG TPA: SMC family ATPase [Thermoleophilia bacterium]|nr:SMC family ATPase [Thermoleophilia bacterium]